MVLTSHRHAGREEMLGRQRKKSLKGKKKYSKGKIRNERTERGGGQQSRKGERPLLKRKKRKSSSREWRYIHEGGACVSISVFGNTVSLLTAIKTITEWIFFFLVPDVIYCSAKGSH